MADEQVSAPENDGSVDFAANAIAALLNGPQTPEPPKEEEAPQSPQAVAPEAPVVDDTPAEPAEAAPDVTTAPVADVKPATQPADNPELSAKVQEAARKTQEAEAARNQYLNALNTLVPQLESRIRGEFADIKSMDDLRNVAATDPDRYNRFVIAQAELNQAQVEQGRVAQQEQQAQTQRLQEWKQQEHTKLGKMIPELSDPEKGPVLARKIQDFAVKNGYTHQQLSNASANDFVILHRAMQYDSLQAQQKVAQQKAAGAPQVQKPGVARTTGTKDDKIQSDFQRLQKTGDVKDAAAVFRNLLN